MQENILFVCNHNSARSQIAEFLLREMYGDQYTVASAGKHPAEQVNPYAKMVLEELGIDVSEAKPKTFEDLKHLDFHYIISVCEAKAEECPAYVFGVVPFNLGIPDPAGLIEAVEDENEKLEIFREARDKLRRVVSNTILRIERAKKDRLDPKTLQNAVEDEFRETVGKQVSAYMREALIVNCPPNDEIICIQQSNLINVLTDETEQIRSADIWAWSGLTISLATTLLTAEFNDFWISPIQWKTIFQIATIGCLIQTCRAFYQLFSKNDRDDFIANVLKRSKGQGLFKD